MLSRSRVLPAPIGDVWDVFTVVEYWPVWGPSVRSVEFDGDRIHLGARGRVVTAPGPSVGFEITEYVERDHWSWQVAGLPATSHRVEIVDDRHTRAVFGVPAVAAPYLAVCEAALRRMERMLSS